MSVTNLYLLLINIYFALAIMVCWLSAANQAVDSEHLFLVSLAQKGEIKTTQTKYTCIRICNNRLNCYFKHWYQLWNRPRISIVMHLLFKNPFRDSNSNVQAQKVSLHGPHYGDKRFLPVKNIYCTVR